MLNACLRVISIGFAVATTVTPSLACSPQPGGAQGLSNYELVRATPVIVLARAKAFAPVSKERGSSYVVMDLVEPLKGNLRNARFSLPGWDRFQGIGDESSFVFPRPGAAAGACLAYDYRVGGLYLLFLAPQQDGTLAVEGPAFSRVNEEVGSAESPWVAAVRHYLQVARLQNEEAEEVALRRLAREPLEGSGQLPAALQADIASHLDRPTVAKPLKRLLVMYRQAQALPTARQERMDEVLWALARRGDAEALPVFNELLSSGAWRQHQGALSEMAQKHAALADRLARLEGRQRP